MAGEGRGSSAADWLRRALGGCCLAGPWLANWIQTALALRQSVWLTNSNRVERGNADPGQPSPAQYPAAGTDLDGQRGPIESLGSAVDRGTGRGDAAEELGAEQAPLKAQAAPSRSKWNIINATSRIIKSVDKGAVDRNHPEAPFSGG